MNGHTSPKNKTYIGKPGLDRRVIKLDEAKGTPKILKQSAITEQISNKPINPCKAE